MAALTYRAPEPEREIGTAGDETSPLLAGTSTDPGTGISSPHHQPPRSETPDHPKFLRVVVICVLCIFFAEVGDYMLRAPLTRVLEDIICRAYYEAAAPSGMDLSLPIPEDDCKIPIVQSELAMLRGWDVMFSCIPGILLAVPYGVLADKYGRKLVLLLALLGAVLGLVWMVTICYFSNYINIRWMWASNAFLLIGGGSSIIKSMFFAMLADVSSEDKRAAVFFQLMAAALISTVVGVPAAWYLMNKNIWLPMIVGVGFVTLGLIIACFLPETLERSKVSDPSSDSESEIEEVVDRPILSRTLSQLSTSKKTVSKLWRKIKASHFIFTSPMLFALSVTFLLQSLNTRMTELLYQLASDRFHWPLGEASFLIPIGSITNFIVLVVLLPALYHVLNHQFHMGPMAKDLIVARGSLLFLILGSLCIAWGSVPSLFILGTIIFACGSGYASATRSLVTSLVQPDEVSRLYAVMAVMETIGVLLYGPSLGKAFGWGLNLGGHWTGMAFLMVAAIFAVVGLPVWFVRPTREMDVHG